MHVDLWGGIPHYCRLDYPFAEDARAKLGAIRRMMEERGDFCDLPLSAP